MQQRRGKTMMNEDLPNSNLGDGPGRFIGAVFGLVFLGIGLTVIGFLWLTPFDQFGSPPLFFRIFGSFIALAFVAVGGTTAYAAISGKVMNANTLRNSANLNQVNDSRPESPIAPPGKDGYKCDSCGAPLSTSADVSPHGDVKCSHCNRWFNVHAR